MNKSWTVLMFTNDYVEAEKYADQYRGDTQTENPVSVVEDLWADKNSPKRFTVTDGFIIDSHRFEIQYTA